MKNNNLSDDNPLVSIIINCYNGEKLINNAIKSILNQSYSNWEIIFWDNRSQDKSSKIFKSYNDKRFNYFCSNKHTNLYTARNLAFSKCNGEYITFLDVDDIWYKNKLQQQISILHKSEYDVCVSNYDINDQVKKKIYKAFKNKKKTNHLTNDLLKKYFIGILTVMLKKNSLNKNNKIFNDQYHIIGDFDLIIKLSTNYKFYIINTSLAKYNLHLNNETNKNKLLKINEFKYWIKNNKLFYTKFKNFIYFTETILYEEIKYNFFYYNYHAAFIIFKRIKNIKLKIKILLKFIILWIKRSKII